MNKDDGGPAFPQLAVEQLERDGHGDPIEPFTSASGGMTLRDWFAGMAIKVAWEALESGRYDGGNREMAECAYQIADAMLAARKDDRDAQA